jgi:hypothetical protein
MQIAGRQIVKYTQRRRRRRRRKRRRRRRRRKKKKGEEEKKKEKRGWMTINDIDMRCQINKQNKIHWRCSRSTEGNKQGRSNIGKNYRTPNYNRPSSASSKKHAIGIKFSKEHSPLK